jgi:putative tryptophan/tyrosine transport system substrate-binding protein
MRRRDFITLAGSAAAGISLSWPLAARAQQAAMPVIGFLAPVSTDEEYFRQGLQQAGFVEGENVSILYRSAENVIDRLPALADDLVRRRVAVIVAIGHTGAFAAKAATTTIPVLFIAAEDPVQLSLVASLARPGGNLTGVNMFATEVMAKRLQLLRQMVPTASRLAVLVDPGSPTVVGNTLRDLRPAAHDMGVEIQVLNASNSQEINAAFATFLRERPDALFVGTGPLFTARRVQLATLAARHTLPITSANRQITEAGGLMSYGASITDAYHQIGIYAGRILKGEKAADLPVVQSSKFELVINAETARMLGLTIPPSLLSITDEVIE